MNPSSERERLWSPGAPLTSLPALFLRWRIASWRLARALLLSAALTGCAQFDDVTSHRQFEGGYQPGTTYRLRVDTLRVEAPNSGLAAGKLVLPTDRDKYASRNSMQFVPHESLLVLKALHLDKRQQGGRRVVPLAAVQGESAPSGLIDLGELSTEFFYPDLDAWLSFPNPAYLEPVQDSP